MASTRPLVPTPSLRVLRSAPRVSPVPLRPSFNEPAYPFRRASFYLLQRAKDAAHDDQLSTQADQIAEIAAAVAGLTDIVAAQDGTIAAQAAAIAELHGL